MSDTIRITCPECGASMGILPQFAGVKVKCPKCKAATIQVPPLEPPPIQQVKLASVPVELAPSTERRPMSRTSKVAIALLAVAGCLMLMCGGCVVIMFRAGANATQAIAQRKESEAKARDLAHKNPVAFVTAPELMEAYQANEVAADAEYKGKWIAVRGTVETIGKDVMGSQYMALDGGKKSPFSVQCMFDDSWRKFLAGCKPGESYRWIVGRCSGKFGNVILRDSAFMTPDELTNAPQ